MSRFFCLFCSSCRCACHGSFICFPLFTGVLVMVLLSAFLFVQVCLSRFFCLLCSSYMCACHGSFVLFVLCTFVFVDRNCSLVSELFMLCSSYRCASHGSFCLLCSSYSHSVCLSFTALCCFFFFFLLFFYMYCCPGERELSGFK